MGWEVNEDNNRKATFVTEENKVVVYFYGNGIKIEVFEPQEDGEDLLMFKKQIGRAQLGLK